MKHNSPQSRARSAAVLWCVLLLPVIYLAVLIAPYTEEGLKSVLYHVSEIAENPTHLIWCERTPKCILICVLIYAMGVGIYLSSAHRYHRRGVENGSATWADISELKKKYFSTCKNKIIYTKHFALSYDKRHLYKHKHNLNTLVVGGPGAGKTRGYVYPNLLDQVNHKQTIMERILNIQQAGSSAVVLDPKGEVVRTIGNALKEQGCKVKVLDLVERYKSWGYNPFAYITSDDDVQTLVTAIFKATTEKGAQSTDPFWDEAGKMLLHALIYLLYYFGSPEEKNFEMVMELIRAGKVKEDDDEYVSSLDMLFERVAMYDANHICVRYYNDYHSGAGKTLKSIQVTLVSRLQKFNLDSIASMTRYDELDLGTIGDKPTVLFLVIPDNDTSYNFIISMLYIQLFQQLYYKADKVYHGMLPCFVHVIMDEFANIHVPDDFLTILATCRSRNIGISIILQNLAQLKTIYKEGWENITGQCDQFLYLGGNEQSTHEYISKMLAKETIDTNTYGLSRGHNGNYSTNYQISGRELMTPGEVRTLSYEYAVLFVKGEPGLLDLKYDVLKHKNAKLTSLCGNKELDFHYGECTAATATITVLDNDYSGEITEIDMNSSWVLMDDEEIEKIMNT